MDDSSAASQSQKLNIATYFLMSSPPGQIDQVTVDVQTLVNDSSTLTPDALASILREYNTDRMIAAQDIASAPGGGKPQQMLITKYGQVGSNLYLEPTTGRVIEFDHLTRRVTRETDKKQVLQPTTDAYRAKLQHHLNAYLTQSYKAGKAVGAVYGADNGICTVCISAQNVSLSNFWSGSWRSVYTVNVSSASAATTALTGSVKVIVHYFEDGNVQLHSECPLQQQVALDPSSSSSIDESCKKIVDAVSQLETHYQNEIEEMYVAMHTQTFKAMRRFLPVSRQKFNWNANAHSIANQVAK